MSKKENIICIIISLFIVSGLWVLIRTDDCQHDFKQGVSLEECREASRDLKIPYPRSFYKCLNCDLIKVTVCSQS